MTEDQANLTRCCGPEGCGGNSAGEPERYCLASRCMGWREGRPLYRQTTKSGAEVFETYERGSCWVEGCSAKDPWLKPVEIKQGYCGLAGKPE